MLVWNEIFVHNIPRDRAAPIFNLKAEELVTSLFLLTLTINRRQSKLKSFQVFQLFFSLFTDIYS